MILDFNKPKRLRSTAEHNEMYASDCCVPGTYVPNMNREDKLKWKAKHIKGDNERIEIRKTIDSFGSCYAQMVIIVRKNSELGIPTITMSSNGKMGFTMHDWKELEIAVKEACEILGV